MKSRIAVAFAALLTFFAAPMSFAAGPGTSGGLTLLEAPGARASALGEAYSAVLDDVAAFSYNPSMLRSLKSGQASFLYQQGLLDDAYSQMMIGSPYRRMGLGLSIGHYNGGDFELNDGINASRSVDAQKDLLIAFGAARSVGPVSIGVTAKYLSSELIERERATAYAADFGLSFTVNPRLNIGGAFQNFGTKLKFVSEGDNLPRIMRMGASYNLFPKYGTLLLFDLQHLFNEKETRPSLGFETRVGPLALRAGYRHSRSLGEFSVGTGFAWNRSSLDYAFGLSNGAQALDSRHRVTYSFRFGGPGGGNQLFVRKATPVKAAGGVHPPMVASKIAAATSRKKSSRKKIYVVRPGDNLALIAKRIYGDHRMWRTIYMANRHMLTSPSEIEVGQKIALP